MASPDSLSRFNKARDWQLVQTSLESENTFAIIIVALELSRTEGQTDRGTKGQRDSGRNEIGERTAESSTQTVSDGRETQKEG